MRKFFSAILNEWRQHWRLLLTLFAAHVLFFGWAATGHCPGEYMMMLIYLALIFLTCAIPPVVMAPNLLNNAAKPPAPTSPVILYWTKFITGITPFILFSMLALMLFIPTLIYNKHPGFDYEFALLILAVFSMGAGLSSLVFFISLMMPKTRRLVVLIMALLETLLLFILMVPGLMGGIALFGTNFFIQETISKMTVFHFIAGDYEGAWGYLIGLAAFSFLTLCIVILPSLGYLLWAKKIVAGKEYLKLLRLGICMLLLAAFALWFIAIKDGQSRLFQAEHNARAEGILYDPEQIRLTPPVPAERNAARFYYKAFRTLKELNQKTEDDYLYYNLESLQTQKDRQRLIDFIQSPDGKQILALIEQAKKYPECRFIPQITERTIELFEIEMAHLTHFVLAKAYVYKITGQENKVLPEVNRSFQLAEIINNQPFRSSLTESMGEIEDTVCNVIKICPENSASVASYRKMLDYLTQYNIHFSNLVLEYDYYSRMLSLQCTFDDGRCWRYSDSNSFSKTVL